MKNEGLRTLFFTLFSPTGSVIGFLFCLAFAEFLRYNKTTEKEMLSVLTKNTEKLSNQELREMMGKVADDCGKYTAGSYIMTDDKAPVELLGMQVIDQLIQDEVTYYKGIYEQEGIKGLLDSL